MKKYTLVKKAYEIDFSKIEEGFLYDSYSFITHAETRNKAKSELLKKAYCENICLKGEGDEVTYLNIPVIRCKSADKYQFEDKLLTKWQIEEKLKERERLSNLDNILENGSDYYYICKGGYYKPGSCGYTDFKTRAGVYTKVEAVSHARGCIDIRLEAIDVKEHNENILNAIADLQTRVL